MNDKEFEFGDWKDEILEKLDGDWLQDEWLEKWEYDDTLSITQSQCEMIERILGDASFHLSKRQTDVLNRVLHEGIYREGDRVLLNVIRKAYLEGIEIK